jgi:hypothetical protein
MLDIGRYRRHLKGGSVMTIAADGKAMEGETMSKALVQALTVLSLVTCLLPSLAQAQSAPAPTVMAFVDKPEHRQMVAATAVDAFEKLQGCDNGTPQPAAAPVLFGNLGPLGFDSSGNLTSGLIKESVIVSGCGKQKVENILTLSDKGQVKIIPGVAGTSKVDPLLAKDSMQYAYNAALPKIGQCKDVKVIDTRYDDVEGPPNPRAKFQANGGRPWRETWTLNACGTLIDSTIHYIPDETGTGIASSMTTK